jgi:hypothetical protein
MRREFFVNGRPAEAWLRLTTGSDYRLAVNGLVLDQQEGHVATGNQGDPVQRTYDLTSFLKQGGNVLALRLTNAQGGTPHLRAEMEVVDTAGHSSWVGSDEEWMGCARAGSDWLELHGADPALWSPCAIESGSLDIRPWLPRRETVLVAVPRAEAVVRTLWELGFLALIAAVTFGACQVVRHGLALLYGMKRDDNALNVVYLPLVLPALALGAAQLALYDPRYGSGDVYQAQWGFLAVASVMLQWGVLLLPGLARIASSRSRMSYLRRKEILRSVGAVCLLSCILAAGFWLRIRIVADEALFSDEMLHYRAVQGFLQRGFPSFKPSEDGPVVYINTAELVMCSMAVTALVVDDPIYVVRGQALFWGTATILLIYVCGTCFFERVTGLIAAALYAVSPICIHMATFGRYPSQLQFFVLLTTLFFWRTLASVGPIDRWFLAATSLSFLAAYFSWEGSVLIAVPMVLAALVLRRGSLQSIFMAPAVWIALGGVLAVVVLQYSHRQLVLTQFLWYGTHASDITFTPMWRYPSFFEPLFWVWSSSWSIDTALPMLGFAASGLLIVRHGYRRPARFLMLIFLGTALLNALVLPVNNWRYVYFLAPLLLLLSSAALAAGARALTRLTQTSPVRPGWQAFAGSVAVLMILATVALASGMTVQPAGIHDQYRNLSTGLVVPGARNYGALNFPNVTGAVKYLQNRVRPGDVIIDVPTGFVEFWMDRPSDYWLQTKPGVVAGLGDSKPLALNRYTGRVVVADLQTLKDIFARNPRIWYVTSPGLYGDGNDAETLAFLRQNMEVVYEDYSIAVMLRDRQHRPANVRRLDEKNLDKARVSFLP